MKKRYQIDKQRAVQQFRRLPAQGDQSNSLVIPLKEVVELAQRGLMSPALRTFTLVAEVVMDREVTALVDQRTVPIRIATIELRRVRIALHWGCPADGRGGERAEGSMPGRMMAIAAHPGDGVFTMGATLAQHIARGGTGALLSLSLGEKGAPRNIPVKQYGEMQRAATEKAMRLLGGESIILSYPDAEIPFNDESSKAVCDVIREQKPEIVITHWNGSWHKDHQNCHLIVHDAIFYAALGPLERKLPAHPAGKLYYAENWEDLTNFQPDVYLDIDSVYDKWMEACDFYPMWRGQTGFFRHNDYYSALAVMRGALSGFKRAVALMSDAEQRTRRVQSL